VTPGGASGYPTTLESLSHVADSLRPPRAGASAKRVKKRLCGVQPPMRFF